MVQLFLDDDNIFETTVEDEAGMKPVWNEIVKIPVKSLDSKISFKVQDSDDGTFTLIGEGGPKGISVFHLNERTTHRFDLHYEMRSAGTISFESTWVDFQAAKARIMEK